MDVVSMCGMGQSTVRDAGALRGGDGASGHVIHYVSALSELYDGLQALKITPRRASDVPVEGRRPDTEVDVAAGGMSAQPPCLVRLGPERTLSPLVRLG